MPVLHNKLYHSVQYYHGTIQSCECEEENNTPGTYITLFEEHVHFKILRRTFRGVP